jgi:hypothetical protein
VIACFAFLVNGMMMIIVKRDKVQFALLQLLFGLCAIAFGCVVVAPNLSAKILSAGGNHCTGHFFAGYQKHQKK